jgi:hypothetical protein
MSKPGVKPQVYVQNQTPPALQGQNNVTNGFGPATFTILRRLPRRDDSSRGWADREWKNERVNCDEFNLP